MPSAPRPLAITPGDAAGIGPEIILRALAQPLDHPVALYAHPRVIELTAQHLRQQNPDLPLASFDATVDLHTWRTSPPAHARRVLIDLSDHLPPDVAAALKDLQTIPFGHEWAAFGHLQGVALEEALEDACAGRVAALVTAPLRKSLFLLAGRRPTGHTELLAERTATPDHVMMLAGDRLRVALVTTHLPLRAVADALTLERILATIRVTAAELGPWLGVEHPRIAVAALNPHAGESGTMGREELDLIGPAVAQARASGLDVHGPFPADTLFAPLLQPAPWPWHAVVCMYHDQALIPLKLLHFGRSANLTLGLPIVRTSVDHGTAYDIAGQGTADIGSMTYALELAVKWGSSRGAPP